MDLTVDQIGEYLEHQGASDSEIDDFLAHFGVRGMKWGVRRAQKLNSRANTGADRFANRNVKLAQRRIDRVSRIASGKASTLDILRGVTFNIPVGYMIKGGGIRGGAQEQLDYAARMQRKAVAGKARVSDAMMRLGGMDIRELDYSYTPAST